MVTPKFALVVGPSGPILSISGKDSFLKHEGTVHVSYGLLQSVYHTLLDWNTEYEYRIPLVTLGVRVVATVHKQGQTQYNQKCQ